MSDTTQASQVSFYSLTATANNGKQTSLEQYKGKYVLIVNLASQCGYTPQYADLEQLYKTHQDKLVILGFPSNDFGAQEPGTDEEIASFCQLNFGVTFPLFKKDSVSGNSKQPVYQWLTDAAQNGWNEQEPNWNFFKYLIDKNGELVQLFPSSVNPMSEELTQHLNQD